MKLFARRPLAAALISLTAAACQPTPQTAAPDPVAAAETLVLDRHDTLMTRTGRLYQLRQLLTAPALKANPRTAPTVRRLLAADAAMMGWMNQYHKPDTTLPAARRLAYFQAQSQRLDAVEKQMRGTIDSATALVNQPK